MSETESKVEQDNDSSEERLAVLVVGSGGREHSLVRACVASPRVGKLIATPGNGGMQDEVEVRNVAADDVEGLVALARDENIDFVIVGPEVPLSLGLVDRLEAEGIDAFGPKQAGARLEASKGFTKDFLERHAIPTAGGKRFTDSAAAIAYVQQHNKRVVIKADGLAAGKGVVIPQSTAEAENAIRAMLDEGQFGDSSREILIEDYMEGEEASIMVVVDGTRYVVLPASQDHKRVGDEDTGPNTGGMGAYAPAAVVTEPLRAQIEQNIIRPTLAGLASEGIEYRGVLYIGIMITTDGAKVVEFNVRFGDPECQVLLPLFASDPVAMLVDCARGTLQPETVRFRDASSVVVVHTSGGYPDTYQKGFPIRLPRFIPEGVSIIHAGTRLDSEGNLVTDGGRVLGVVAVAPSLQDAVRAAYEVSTKVSFDHAHFRQDIGWRELQRSV